MKNSHSKTKIILVNLLLVFFVRGTFNQAIYAQVRILTEHQSEHSARRRNSKNKLSFPIYNELCKDALDRFPVDAWQNLLDQ